jgi:hypothetical protein
MMAGDVMEDGTVYKGTLNRTELSRTEAKRKASRSRGLFVYYTHDDSIGDPGCHHTRLAPNQVWPLSHRAKPLHRIQNSPVGSMLEALQRPRLSQSEKISAPKGASIWVPSGPGSP